MVVKLILVLLIPMISCGIHMLYLIKLDPADFNVHHQKKIRGDQESVFEFLMSPQAIEKLLPWLMRFREADKRIISAGKSYTAFIGMPIIGEKRVRAILSDYKPSKSLIFEFSDDFVRQRIAIQTRKHQERTVLQATIYFDRESALFQFTIGYALRLLLQSQLETSMENLAIMFETLDDLDAIPDFSRKNAR